MFLTDMLALSHVPRWCIVPTIRPQSVGDHVYRVMVIFEALSSELEVPYVLSDLLAVLQHDYAEARSGDIPTPYKNTAGIEDIQPAFSSEAVARLFLLADRIEAYTFIERYGFGPHAKRVAIDLQRKVKEMADVDFPKVMRLVDYITFEIGR